MVRTGAALVPLVALVAAIPAAAQTPAGGEFMVNTWTTHYQQAPSVAAGQDGSFVVVWESRPVCMPPPDPCFPGQDGSRSGVFGQRHDARGARVGVEFRINVTTAYDQATPAIAALRGGRFVVVWTSTVVSVGPATIGRILDRTGQPVGAEFTVAGPYPTSGPLRAPAVSAAASGFVAAWWDGAGDLRVRRFATDGAPLGSEFQVNSLPTPWNYRPGIGGDALGHFTVAWAGPDTGGGDIFARRFDPLGAPMGPEFRVNSTTSGVQGQPDVEVAPDGAILIVWEDFSASAFVGRRSDGPLGPFGSEFQVGTVTTISGRAFPAIAADSAGAFLVTWPDVAGAPPSIKGRRYDEVGTPGAEFRVDASPNAKGQLPAVALDDASNAVVAWSSAQDGSLFGVYARRFGGIRPASLDVDAVDGPSSNGNRVFEPGEAVAVEPTWRNVTGSPLFQFTARASRFTGPPPPSVYSIVDDMAAYPDAPDNAVTRCRDQADCYSMGVLDIGRPATHWDAVFREDLNPGAPDLSKAWTVHLGRSFDDLPLSSPFYRFVETLLHHAVTGGCGGNLFCPAAPTSREQMSVFVLLAREGSGYLPPACGPAPLFADVPSGSPFCRWVEELARRGVVVGCGGGHFCPQAAVTREQMALFVLRTLEPPPYLPPACGTPVFGDVPASSPFCRWIEELARRGVVAGCGGGAYCPGSAVTREQMSVFLGLTFGLQLYGP